MKRRLLSCAILAWACLGVSLAGADPATYLWNGSTGSSGSTSGGDFNSNFWELGTTLAKTPGTTDIAQVSTNPSKSPVNFSNDYLGLDLSAAFGLSQDASGNYLDQIGALQIEPRLSLWIGVDKGTGGGSGTGNGVLVLNGATVAGLENVAIDMESWSTTTASALTFQNTVGAGATGNTFALRLGTPVIPGHDTFVIRAVAPSAPVAGASLFFNAGIGETVAGSAINFRGGGTDTKAGALVVLAQANTFTGGIVLGATGAATSADEDGVVLESKIAAALPSTGDILVNKGSTLWLDGQGQTVGADGQTLTLNGTGAAANSSLNGGATGALLSDATDPALPESYVGKVELASDSTVTVAGAGTLALSGQVSGTGALVKGGVGTLLLAAANDYTGGTQITAGTVEAADASALGDAAGPVQIGSGGKLRVDVGVRLAQAQVGLSAGGSYLKQFSSGESLANFQAVRSDAGTVAGIVAGKAGGGETVTATFGANSHGESAGEMLTLSGLDNDVYALTLQTASLSAISIERWNSTSSLWEAATTANDGGNAPDAGFFAGTFAEFEAEKGVTDATLGSFLGWYGSDAATGQAWAVVNADGDFAAMATVPEPGTWSFLALGIGLLLVQLRHVGRGGIARRL